MKSKRDFVFSALKLRVFIVLCIVIGTTKALETNGVTVAPLAADQPVSDGQAIVDHKDLKKIETRLHDPPPEYYK